MPDQQPDPFTMTKGDFAKLCNVDPSRVSHWIKDGRINGAALVGSGRSARIVVDVAQKQLRGNLDPYQMMQGGNGAATRLDARPPVSATDDKDSALSDDAEKLWAILAEVPSDAAWQAAEPGETTQRAFDTFMGMRMNLTAFMRMRGFEMPDGVDSFSPVDWPGMAEEMGLTLIDPKRMTADWQRRRDAD